MPNTLGGARQRGGTRLTTEGWDLAIAFTAMLSGLLVFVFARDINAHQAKAVGRSGDRRFVERYLLFTRVGGVAMGLIGAWNVIVLLLAR